MSTKTRKYVWPGALAMSIAVVGLLAAFLVLGSNPAVTDAHGGAQDDTHCAGMSRAQQLQHDLRATDPVQPASTHHTCDDATNAPSAGTDTDDISTMTPTGAMIESSSTSASVAVELKLTIPDLPMDLEGGSSVVLYLEDDFQVPDNIDRDTVYFTAKGGSAADDQSTSNGRRVYATDPVEIDTDDHFTADKKDWDIQVLIPDMNTSDVDQYSNFDGPKAGQTLTLIFTKSSDIKNNSEAGTHSVGYSILGPTDSVEGPVRSTHRAFPRGSAAAKFAQVSDTEVIFGMHDAPGEGFAANVGLRTRAKIELSDVDNDRGYELTVTGTGFNNDTSATVHVLGLEGNTNPYLWDALSCPEMVIAVGNTDTANSANPYCKMYNGLGADEKAVVDALDFTSGDAEKQLCSAIIRKGHQAGIADVGSDDTATVVFEVTVPIFVPGNNNFICMVDGEGRQSDTDVEDFKLLDSISVIPSSANAGDTVNVFARDFPNENAPLTGLRIHGHVVWPRSLVDTEFPGNYVPVSADPIGPDGSATATFDLPGSLSGVPLEGTVRIDARWGGEAPFNEPGKTGVSEDSKITVTGSELRVSKGEVRPNESVTIQGDGFGTGNNNHIMPMNITIDGVALLVDSDSLTDDEVEVSSAGQFVATVSVWPDDEEADNPTLISGTHTIRVEDNQGFFGTVTVVIKEPSMSITPDVLGPRDYLTVTGTDWPVDNTDSDANIDNVAVEVEGRTYTAIPDATGRFTVEHRVKRDVAIPSTQQVKATYGDSGDIVKITSFEVPEAIIVVTPGVGQPGDTVSLSATGMPVYTEVEEIDIGGANVLGGHTFRTDRDGAVTAADLLIPGLDPGTYSIIMKVGGGGDQVIAIGSLNVLAEGVSGPAAKLPAALDTLGDSLVRVFHFDGVTKTWDFFDPRSDFAELNTLSGMEQGQPYWILVSEGAEDVVLNNKARTLTCVGGDCWNQIVW